MRFAILLSPERLLPGECGLLFSSGVNDADCERLDDFVCECDGFRTEPDNF